MNVRFPSNNIEYYREAITSNNPDKVREIQKTFANLTPEEQIIIQSLIDEVIWDAKNPMKNALSDLSTTMNLYSKMEWWRVLPSRDWLRDGEWRFKVEAFPRNNITLAWGRNISAFEPTWAWSETLVWHTWNDTLDGTVRSLTSPKLPEIWVDRAKAFQLATKTLWATPTRDALRIYQKEQKLKSVDGVIWKETYSEMYAAVVLEKANDRIDEFGISEKTQKEILWVLNNGNTNGKNVMILRAFLKSQHEVFKAKSDYDSKYKSFYVSIEKYETTTLATPESKAVAVEVEKELHKKDKDGRSMYRRIKDGIDNGNISEEMASLIQDKWPMALFLLAGAFVFGMIPWVNDTVATNTWWKRLLVGGVALANRGSLEDIAIDLAKWGEKVAKYVRSEDAKRHYKTWEDLVASLWDKLPDSETFGTSVDGVKKVFNSTIWWMEWVNHTFKKADIAKYIEWFTGKASVILSDDGFLNTPKSTIATITNLKDLEAVMTKEGYKKLIDTHKMSDSDVANFMSQHMDDKLKDAVDTDIVRKTLFGSEIVTEIKQAALNSGKSFNTNPAINTSIKTELSNILNGSGSETYKQAGTDLWIALQTWTLNQFSLQAYKSLWSTEKPELDALLKKLLAIQAVQQYIANQVLSVNTIEVKTEWLADTPTTLAEDFVKLEKIKTDFALNTVHVAESWIDASDYETSAFDMAYAAKRQEILEYARVLWMTSIWAISDIQEELNKSKKAEEAIKLEQNIDSLIDAITDLPPVNASALELRSWWDENESELSSLKEKKRENSGKAIMVAKIDEALKFETAFVDRYKQVRETAIKTLQDSQKEIDAIKTWTAISAIELRNKKQSLDSIRQDIEETMNSIVPWLTASGIFTSLSNLISWKDSTMLSKNAINDLDLRLKPHWFIPKTNFNFAWVGQTFSEKVVAIESDLDIHVDISKPDVSNGPDVAQIVTKLQELENTVDTLDSSDVKERKSESIAKVYSEIAKRYITALQGVDTLDKLDTIKRSYDANISGKFGNTIDISWKALWNGFIKHDEVTQKYDEMKVKVTQLEQEKDELEKAVRLNEKRAEYLKTLSIDTDTFVEIAIIKDISETDAWKKAIKNKFGVSIEKIESYSEDRKPKTVNGKQVQMLTSSWIGDNFPMNYQKFKELLQIWRTNPDLSDFHTDIDTAISGLNQLADKNITK